MSGTFIKALVRVMDWLDVLAIASIFAALLLIVEPLLAAFLFSAINAVLLPLTAPVPGG